MTWKGQIRDATEHRLAQAAAWRLRLEEAGIRTSPDFESWLREPGSLSAWDRVGRAWSLFGDGTAPELAAARQAALADAQAVARDRSGPARLRRLVGVIAAALVIGLGATAGYWWTSRPDDYRTAMGERRVITLSDGSRLSLDSGSEVTVSYGRHDRSLRLLRGQARFDVAHDKSRPFSVVAGNQKVVATGTAFNIDMAGPKVLVTLIEGHVLVMDESGDVSAPWPKVVALKAGQQLAAVPSAAPEVSSANIQRVTAWTIGQMMFDDEPLSSVVDRVNRYGGTQIVIADPRVAAMRISGVFNAGDTLGFVEIVTHYLPVKAVQDGPQAIALQGETGKKNY